ncbi:helix-turn-helix domain-containing protein [Nesterenkonia haasae]|uniref:helix-turn-helix domain-containing protein n=1 Tax=Nesterenkonia haasae TaxID=2587813 RepID=UPI001391A421|nr:helix-turn-helix domain-containing protein [Nesterenkonia haasae]NDK31164.1 helix-turn-helix domain-containing protein [Nesterenkonia haasae]
MPRRFYTIPEVAESLATSEQQIRALLRNGELEGIQIGGRGQWRIEDAKLDEYIERMYAAQRSPKGRL